MENASKALIIAGAILLAIVIISLGLIVVNNSKETISKSGLDSQEIESFNAKFTGYQGTNVTGSRVNSLIQTVIATNQATANEGKNNFIRIGFCPSNWVSYAQKYLYISANNSGILYSSRQTGLTAPTYDSLKSSAEANFNGAVAPTLSVETGKNYNVSILYANGLVDVIKVQ